MRSALVLAFALVVACGSFGDAEEDSAPSTDGGSTPDGGGPSEDAGVADGASTTDGAPSRNEQVLAGNRELPISIAADETTVVWGEDTGKVQRMSIDGGTVDTVSTYSGSPRQVLVRVDEVLWGDHTVDKMGLWHHGSGTGDNRTASTLGITGFAQFGTSTDWATYSSGTSIVTIISATGQTVNATPQLPNPYDIVTDGDGVLVTLSGAGTIARIATSAPGTVDAIIQSQSDCRELARNASAIFWSIGETIVRRYDRAMTVTTDLSKNEVGVHALTADETGVYWLTNDSLRRWSPVTSSVETLASGFETPPDTLSRGRFHQIALTSKYIVWLTKNDVRRIEK